MTIIIVLIIAIKQEAARLRCQVVECGVLAWASSVRADSGVQSQESSGCCLERDPPARPICSCAPLEGVYLQF